MKRRFHSKMERKTNHEVLQINFYEKPCLIAFLTQLELIINKD